MPLGRINALNNGEEIRCFFFDWWTSIFLTSSILVEVDRSHQWPYSSQSESPKLTGYPMMGVLSDGFLGKMMHSFGHCPNYLPPKIRKFKKMEFRRAGWKKAGWPKKWMAEKLDVQKLEVLGLDVHQSFP